MTVDPKRYGKGKKASPIMVNIRLSRRGPKPTAAEVTEVLEEILATETVPPGWRLAFIDWKRPRVFSSSGWRRGKLDAFADLAPVIQTALHNARISIVRKGGKR